jgi:hypothetical protein
MRLLLVAAVAAAIGFGLGLLVDQVWPNPVYGYQIMAGLLAVALVVVAILIRRAHPLILPASIGLAVGVFAGVAVGLALRQSPAYTTATIRVQLTAPVVQTLTGTAQCSPLDDGTVPVVITDEDGSALQLAGGRGLSVVLYPNAGNLRRPDGLGIEVQIFTPGVGGAMTSTWMTSDLGSSLSAAGTQAAGTLTFSGVTLHPESELRQPIDVVGTVTWSCPAAS